MASLWPRTSSNLCWHCCHPFDGIPVYLPVSHRSSPHCLYLSGNFCSFNCVKSYYFHTCKNARKADSVHLITLLCFLSYHRPTHCPSPHTKHRSDCPCLLHFKGIPMAKNKETLVSFGGTQTIDEFRKGFMTIKDISMIEKCFFSEDSSNQSSICNSPEMRRFTYCFSTPQNTEKQTKEEEYIGPPVVHKRVTKYKRLLN
jgi:hypothetical protein